MEFDVEERLSFVEFDRALGQRLSVLVSALAFNWKTKYASNPQKISKGGGEMIRVSPAFHRDWLTHDHVILQFAWGAGKNSVLQKVQRCNLLAELSGKVVSSMTASATKINCCAPCSDTEQSFPCLQ